MMKQVRPTVANIAKLARVSNSTVSRALSGKPGVSKSKREEIAKIAANIGYQPNAIARGLVTNRSGLIAMVVGQFSNPFYPERLERVIYHLSRRNYNLMLFQVPETGDVSDTIRNLLQYQIEGCILTGISANSKVAVHCSDLGIPAVLCNRAIEMGDSSAVVCDNEGGGRLIAQLLADAGHKRIAFISGAADKLTSRDREIGFVAGLKSRNMDLYARVQGSYTFESGMAAVGELLRLPEPPDAIFAASDIIAFGALDALRQAGVRVPEDISVIGFDDVRAASWPSYNLTTFTQPLEQLVIRSIDLLLERINNPSRPHEVIYIGGSLRTRGTARLADPKTNRPPDPTPEPRPRQHGSDPEPVVKHQTTPSMENRP